VQYDVIVVGGRVAGAATAMLLARQGLRVLVLERAAEGSDTVSSHQVQLPGVARLRRWGVLDGLDAAGTPPTREVRLDLDGVVLRGRFPCHGGGDALYSPRRPLLDALLVDAARAAGAEVRHHVRVEELIWSQGRVTGVCGRDRRGSRLTGTAGLVVGADGKNSFVAAAVGARAYRERPAAAFASYGYWSGVDLDAGELYQRAGLAVAAFPTNDGLTMVYTAAPLAGFAAARADLAGHHLAALDRCGDLGQRVRAGTRVERLRTTPDQPNRFRAAYGPGWALVGDAGVVMDSVSAQGISNALRDADLLAAALGAQAGTEVAMRARWRTRDRGLRGMYDLTADLARFAPAGPARRRFLAAVADRPDEVTRFLAAFTGVESPSGYGRSALLRMLTRRPQAGLESAGRCPFPARRGR
jgi:2-polyprenyl-6-methoxyphenol hydroxylase-like FAD-dependent oxidoreductase